MESRLWTVLPAVVATLPIGAVLMQFLTPPVSGTSLPSHGMATAAGFPVLQPPQSGHHLGRSSTAMAST